MSSLAETMHVELSEQARLLESLAIDTTDFDSASEQLEKIGEIFDKIPSDTKALKQYAPVIAVYKAKLISLRSRLDKAFFEAVELSASEGKVNIHHELFEMDKLWLSAERIKYLNSIFGDISTRLTDEILSRMINMKSIMYSLGDREWKFKEGEDSDPTRQLASIRESIVSLFAFLRMNLFLGNDQMLSLFGRICWVPFAGRLLKKFGPSEELSNMESSLLRLHAFPADAPRKLITSHEESCKGAKSIVHNKILSEIRSRLLADISHKVIPTQSPPNAQVMEKLGFFPKFVSFELVRMVGDFFIDHPDLIKQMVTLYAVMRQSQFLDPQALFPKNSGIFFADCAFLSVTLAMMQRDELVDSILLLRLCAERSIEHFTQLSGIRIKNRLHAVAPNCFDLGLCSGDEEKIADKAIETSLMEIATCLREWRAIQVDVNVLMLWISVMCDSVLRSMNNIAVNCAKSAVRRAHADSNGGVIVNTVLWSVWNRFLSSVEMMLPEEYSKVMNNYKVSKRIQNALSGTVSDIRAVNDPVPNDEQLFGITPEGFEFLLMCNPVLQRESKQTIKSLVGKLIISTNFEAPASSKTQTGEKDFAALFNRG